MHISFDFSLRARCIYLERYTHISFFDHIQERLDNKTRFFERIETFLRNIKDIFIVKERKSVSLFPVKREKLLSY